MPDNKEVTLREITEDTLRPFLKMEVSEVQKDYVAPNAVSIAQAHFSKHAWFRGIYAGDEPVGFVMLHIDEDEAEYFVWRYMIAEGKQGHGYGYRAMEKVIEFVRTHPNAKTLLLSYSPGPHSPDGFYAKLGFKETGKWDEGEKIMVLHL